MDRPPRLDLSALEIGTLEEAMAFRCPTCGSGVQAWYGDTVRALNTTCANDCLIVKTHGLITRPKWARAGANTTINTGSGELTVEEIPRQPTLREIDDERGVMDARLRPNGWTKCPFCGFSFATYSEQSWRNGRHVRCSTKLNLIDPQNTDGDNKALDPTPSP